MAIKDEDKRAELVEHLAELRTRLIRSVVYIVIGAILAWILYDYIFNLLTRPMTDVLKGINTKFLLSSFTEPFMIRMQICIVSGLILMSPFLTMEIWGFVSPGLTHQEKKAVKLICPLSVLLFLLGVFVCYHTLPSAFKWFSYYIPKEAELRPSVQVSVLFTVKMLLAFGVVFELPVVLMFLSKVGIVDSRFLLDNWRVAMVAVAVIAAVATPSNDAFTMLMMAVPVAALYFLSIFLVRIGEGRRRYY